MFSSFSLVLQNDQGKEGQGGGSKTYRKAKPREDGPLETTFGDPPNMVSEVT